MTTKRGSSWTTKLRQLGFALIPALLAVALVIGAMAVRVTTPVELDILVRAVTLTVAGETPVLVLNNSTAFAAFGVEGCGSVSFPRLSIALPEGAPFAPAGAVTFRCDLRIPGAKVLVRGAETAPGAAEALGSIGRILAAPGDRLGLELTNVSPPEIRVEMSRRVSFDLSLRGDAPFAIVTEFADVDGIPKPVDPDGVIEYRASFAGPGTERLATVDSGPGLNMVVQPARSESAELFRANVVIPVESVSLFQRSDADDAFVSTAVNGTLNYAGRPAAESVQISAGENVRLRSTTGFRLTRLHLDGMNPGIWLRLEGDAEELSSSAVDRRLTLFDRVGSDRNRNLLGIVAVVASQLVWLRKYLWPASK